MTLDDAAVAEICEHARAEFPRECCGYVRGARGVGDEVVRCTNAETGRAAERAFMIDGAELFAFARAFHTDRPPVVIYHSHTNGRAYWSDVDRANAAYRVHNLVVGIDATGVTELALFDAAGREVARFAPRC